MLSHVDWVAFLFAMAAIELTPGPNMGWLAALSAQRGRRAGMLAVCGITLGLTAQLIAAATGLSALLGQIPILYEALRWTGVAFMVFLAYEAWRDTGETSPLNRNNADGFWRGIVANLLNPKALLFYVVVVGQFATAQAPAVWQQILMLGAIHVAIATLIHALIVILGASLGDTLESYRTAPGTRAVFALMMLAIAAWIAVSTGRAAG